MPLSKRVVRELHRELKNLQSIRDGALARIGALEILLTEAKAVEGRERVSRMDGRVPDSRGGRPSLRARVLTILEEVSSSSAGDMARRLEATGFEVGGSTTLRERVAHELSRLRRKGVVQRARDGHYEIARQELKHHDSASRSIQEELNAPN